MYSSNVFCQTHNGFFIIKIENHPTLLNIKITYCMLPETLGNNPKA